MQTPILGLLNQNYLWEEAKKESIYIHLCTHINRYLTIQFIYLQIKFTKLYKHHHNNLLKSFTICRRKPKLLADTTHFSSFLFPLPPYAKINLLSFSMNKYIKEILYKSNLITYGLLLLPFFNQYVFKVYPCCNMYQ